MSVVVVVVVVGVVLVHHHHHILEQTVDQGRAGRATVSSRRPAKDSDRKTGAESLNTEQGGVVVVGGGWCGGMLGGHVVGRMMG